MNHDLVRVYERTTGLSSWVAVCQCGALLHGNYERDVIHAHSNHRQDQADEAMTCPNGCYLGTEAGEGLVSRALRQAVTPTTALLRCPSCHIAWATGPADDATAGLLVIANFGIPA